MITFDSIYPTKCSDGVKFKPISWFSERSQILNGYYVGKEHMGLCPLPIERLILPPTITLMPVTEGVWLEIKE